MIITPSLLEKNAVDLFAQIKKLAPYFRSFQIDIADNIDAPNITVQIDEISEMIFNNKSFLSGMTFEFHLMVYDYQSVIKKIYELKTLINIRDILVHSKYLPDINSLTNRYSFPIGLVLYPDDSVETITNNYPLENIPYIQIMSCRVGFRGTPFVVESLDKIEQLRIGNYRNKISLDGGINDQSLPVIMSKKYRPDILCPDSYLVFAEDLKKRVDYLKEVMEKEG